MIQRHKGRDLIDLSHSLQVFEDLNTPRVVELLGLYLAATNLAIPRAEAEQRMFAKLEKPAFLVDVRQLLTADEADRFDDRAAKDALVAVFSGFCSPHAGRCVVEDKRDDQTVQASRAE